jgi:hypothetical protein
MADCVNGLPSEWHNTSSDFRCRCAFLRHDGNMRTLVTAKWSVRADREKQFTTDFTEYLAAEAARRPFEYVFVTNEFDPARLMRACETLAANAPMFAHVVHINLEAIRATYGSSPEESMKKVIGFIDSGRLLGIDQPRFRSAWKESLASAP